jgi:hypothetical protein
MKRLICILFLLLGLVSSAQTDREKLEALRVSFITDRLKLGSSESARFWPVYNEYNDKIREIRRGLRQSYHVRGELSEKEAEEIYQRELTARTAEAEVHRLYASRLKQIIGPVRFVTLRQAEEEFKRQMLKAID